MIFTGQVTVNFEIMEEEPTPGQLKALQKHFHNIIEASSAELEDAIDQVDLNLISTEVLTIEKDII